MKISHILFPLLLLGLAPYARSQCNKGGIDRSSRLNNNQVDFALSHPVPDTNNDPSVSWSLYDLSTQSAVVITDVHYDSPPSSNTGLITLKSPINTADTYILSVSNLRFIGCPNPVQTNFTRVITRRQGIHPYPPSAASSRDNADVYISGLLNGAQGTHASYTADVKLQLPVFFSDKWLGGKTPSGKKKARTFELAFIPSTDFKISTDPKANGNSVLIGSGVRATVPMQPGQPNGHLFTDWLPYVGYSLEADKNFSNLNNLVRFVNYFNTRSFGELLQLNVRPMITLEAGTNSKTAKGAIYDGAIIRPSAGLHAYANFYKKAEKDGTWTRRGFVESDYTRRWPLHAEPASTSDAAGKLKFTSGTNPRDYVSTKLGYDFSQYFGLSLQHDYGQLPPLFTKVQNKYTIGLTLKMGLQYKPK